MKNLNDYDKSGSLDYDKLWVEFLDERNVEQVEFVYEAGWQFDNDLLNGHDEAIFRDFKIIEEFDPLIFKLLTFKDYAGEGRLLITEAIFASVKAKEDDFQSLSQYREYLVRIQTRLESNAKRKYFDVPTIRESLFERIEVHINWLTQRINSFEEYGESNKLALNIKENHLGAFLHVLKKNGFIVPKQSPTVIARLFSKRFKSGEGKPYTDKKLSNMISRTPKNLKAYEKSARLLNELLASLGDLAAVLD